MIVAVCVDDRGGMLFHNRRQSQDRLARADLMRLCGTKPLWMNAYSAELFGEYQSRIHIEELFLSQSERGDFCFVENRHLMQFADRIEAVVLYHWNRVYPTDFRLDLELDALNFSLTESTEFSGSSHERITREIYARDVQSDCAVSKTI